MLPSLSANSTRRSPSPCSMLWRASSRTQRKTPLSSRRTVVTGQRWTESSRPSSARNSPLRARVATDPLVPTRASVARNTRKRRTRRRSAGVDRSRARHGRVASTATTAPRSRRLRTHQQNPSGTRRRRCNGCCATPSPSPRTHASSHWARHRQPHRRAATRNVSIDPCRSRGRRQDAAAGYRQAGVATPRAPSAAVGDIDRSGRQSQVSHSPTPQAGAGAPHPHDATYARDCARSTRQDFGLPDARVSGASGNVA